jgi:hypothetical protein
MANYICLSTNLNKSAISFQQVFTDNSDAEGMCRDIWRPAIDHLDSISAIRFNTEGQLGPLHGQINAFLDCCNFCLSGVFAMVQL